MKYKMKKTSNVFKISALCLILLLLILLFAALTGLLFRVWAPERLTSCLNNLMNWASRKKCLDWLPEAYRVLSSLAHNSCGKLDPLAYLMGLTGLINFALIAIDTLVAKRTFGILLQNVVDYFFPYYQLIQFWLHLCFYILGGYACEKGFGQVAALCAIGLFFCFCHAIAMYGLLHLSVYTREKMVLRYIRTSQKKPDKVDRNCLHDFADYLNQQWRCRSFTQIQRAKEPDLEKELVCCMANFLGVNRSDFQRNDSQSQENLSEYYISEKFLSSFENSNRFPVDRATYVIQSQIPPCSTKQLSSENKVYFDSKECRLIWEILLQGEDSGIWKSRLTGRIITTVLNEQPHLFAPMAWGLILYLKLGCSNISDGAKDEEYQAHLTKQLYFLLQIITEYEVTLDSDHSEEVIKRFRCAWGQIVYLSLALIHWSEVHNIVPPEAVAKGSLMAKGIIRTSMTNQDTQNILCRNIDSYLANAFFLLLMENPDLSSQMSAYTFLQLITVMREKCRLD